MKRPPSVITTLILFGIFAAIGLLTVVSNAPSEIAAILAGSLMPTLFLIGWVGIFLKKNWSRVYSSVLIFLFGLIMLALPFINKAEQGQKYQMLIFSIIMFTFMLWWAFSLLMGKASKEYFLSTENA